MVVDAARFLEEDAWGEELPQEQALERARNLASEETGLLFGLAASYKMVDLPKLYQYGVSVTPARLISDASSALNLVVANEGTGTSFVYTRRSPRAAPQVPLMAQRFCGQSSNSWNENLSCLPTCTSTIPANSTSARSTIR